MADLQNKLTWSVSRHRTFAACRRRYYYQYYLSWGGWKAESPQISREAYRCKQMTSYLAKSGDIVHQCIASALQALADSGKVMPLDRLLLTASGMWRQAQKESESGRWAFEPKKVCCLFEDRFVEPAERKRLKEMAWRRIQTCLTNFHHSETWEQIQKSKPNRWLASDLEDFQTAPIMRESSEGVSAYAIDLHGRPDFAYGIKRAGLPHGNCYLFDWKTGKPRDEDTNQMRFYALYASQIWGFPCSDIKVRLIYLAPDLEETECSFSEDHISYARMQMEESHGQMRELLEDIEANAALPIGHFLPTPHQQLCGSCSFQEICSRD